MEIKDFVLLVAIPILLIGIVYYADKSNFITGAAAAAKVEDNILGFYSVMPSFKAKIGYNIEEEYKKVKSDVQKLIDECSNSEDMEKCVKAKAAEKGMACADNNQMFSILTDFIDIFNECSNIAEDNVVCKFNLDAKNYINTQKSIRSFNIELSDWYYGKTKVELKEDGKVVAAKFISLDGLYSIDFDKRNSADRRLSSVTIQINYKDGISSVEKIFGMSEDAKQQIDLAKSFLFYRSNKMVKFIEFPYESSFSVPSLPANKIVILPITKGAKLCVKSGRQVIAYDSADGLVKQRDIIYRLAVTFPKSVPKPIENLKIYDSKKAEKSIIIVWDNPKQDDIISYSVYYSKKEFINDKIEDIKNNAEVRKVSIESDNFKEINIINLERCTNPDAPCKYEAYDNTLEKEKLYYWKEKNKFIYVLKGIEDDVEYNIAATAVNDEGEISNDKSIKGNTYVLSLNGNYAKATSIDDLAPGKVTELKPAPTPEGKIKLTWKKPLKNLDGTDNNDLAAFNIYFKKSTSDLLPQLELDYRVIKISAKDAKCDVLGSLSCEFNIDNIPGLEKGQNYNFAVASLDEKSNEYKAESEKVAIVIP